DLGNGVFAPPGIRLLTVCRYGSPLSVEYISAVVHEDSAVIASEVYCMKDMSEEQATLKACDLGSQHGMKGAVMFDSVCPFEFTSCGSLAIRIADGEGRSVPYTYKPHDTN